MSNNVYPSEYFLARRSIRNQSKAGYAATRQAECIAVMNLNAGRSTSSAIWEGMRYIQRLTRNYGGEAA